MWYRGHLTWISKAMAGNSPMGRDHPDKDSVMHWMEVDVSRMCCQEVVYCTRPLAVKDPHQVAVIQCHMGEKGLQTLAKLSFLCVGVLQ